jgi:peptidoglycan/xylan/chitin deacetylase (PgdA/CDA1 family)
MYHRIAEVDSDPWSLCVTQQNFAEHLEVLQKYFQPKRLQQLAQAHRNGNIAHRSVVITFDDGYADNLYHAKPLLEQYNIPATVFITTGCLGREREFWWDELEWLLLQPGSLPGKLSLNLKGGSQQWELGEAVYYSETDYQRDRQVKAWESQSSSRLFFYYSVWQQLQPLPQKEQLKALEHILTWSDAEPASRSHYRSLLPEEVCVLGQGELVEIGAHTVTHPFLSAHSIGFQQEEIQHSKAYLEELLNYPVTSFSYPFGNYTAQTVRLIQEAGFTCSCSTRSNTVWQGSDCFQFPRFQVENWNGEEFVH